MKMECQILSKMEEIMLKLSRFCYNHHLSGVKMLAKFIRRGIRVLGNRLGFSKNSFLDSLARKTKIRKEI